MRISDWSSDVCSSDLNARMQNPQNALDHPLSSLSIQWQERHDRLPPRVVDQLEFSPRGGDLPDLAARNRSEEHTSELQSLMRRPYAVFCLTKTIIGYTKDPKSQNTTQ